MNTLTDNLDKTHNLTIINQYLDTQNIPYYNNKLHHIIGEKFGDNVIIPGHIILNYSINKFCHKEGTKSYSKQLFKLYKSNIKQHIYIYIYNYDNTSEDNKKMLNYIQNEYFTTTYDLNITYITDITQIKSDEFIYVINSCGPIYTLVVLPDNNPYTKFKYYIGNSQYQRALTYMNEHEVNLLKRYDIIIDDDIINNTQYKVNFKNCKTPTTEINYLTTFHKYMKYIPLPGGTRNPIKVIEGHTTKCIKCNQIFNNHYIVNTTCFKCRGEKIKRYIKKNI